MSETMGKHVEDAIVAELMRQNINARTWGNCFQGLNPPVRWDDVAKAAIAAMREPSEAMVEAGDQETWDSSTVWRAMIDAALK